ncbi:MAG: phosphoribosylformylglycinamidine cyclo-ligase [Erysipelotrichaceae bacterium]
MSEISKSNLYREAGVDLQAGYESVRLIKSHVARTKIKGAVDSIGAFGGTFDISALGYKEPVLVSGTDGVGTKLMLAFEMNKHDTIGIDAVAMCVNDVLAQGAAPIFFLDYLAVGKNVPTRIEQIVKGVADGCVESECALIGGETAEMPDMYDENHYDIAGFCVGAVEKSKFIDGSKVSIGDTLIGIPSTGCHSNGFSLIRKILLKDGGMDLHQQVPELGKTLGEELMTPTKLYVKAMKHLFDKIDIHGACNITGGGFYENVPRMLKENQGVKIDTNTYPHLPIFDLMQKVGKVENKEMYNVFNMGIGFVLAVDSKDAQKTIEYLAQINEKAYVIGEVTRSGSVELVW